MAKRDNLLSQLRTQQQSGTKPQYDLSTTNAAAVPTAVELPEEAQELATELRELALQFLGARRRIGEALVESARLMAEARELAEEGQWYTFLSVTQTSADVAERLINIHLRTQQNPAFADAVRRGWFNQTVAARLATASTPDEVIETLTQGEQPPKASDVNKALKAHRENDGEASHNVDNPHKAGSSGASEVVDAMPGAAVGSAPVEGEPAAPQQYVDDLSPREAAALRERVADLEQRMAAAQSIIEEYQEHITRAQRYKANSDRGEAVSPLLRALERVGGVLRRG